MSTEQAMRSYVDELKKVNSVFWVWSVSCLGSKTAGHSTDNDTCVLYSGTVDIDSMLKLHAQVV